MKIILGDNQFFGVNHFDLKKGEKTKNKFDDTSKIKEFIKKSHKIGLDGFMINSNDLGYKVVQEFDFRENKAECHYSIPYPHKYAGMVNESGMTSLLKFAVSKLKLKDVWSIIKFVFSFNAKHLIPIIVAMEIPEALPKGSVVYLQNIITDLIMGLKNGKALLIAYINSVSNLGYKPGLISLNPTRVYKLLGEECAQQEVHLCFNLNMTGFNVFPSLDIVKRTVHDVKMNTRWNLMAMSILSSGGKGMNVKEAFMFIKAQNIDYVVFGSSRIENIKSNIASLR